MENKKYAEMQQELDEQKDSLLEEFFRMEGFVNPKAIQIVEDKLKAYAKEHTGKQSAQIRDALRIIYMLKAEHEHNDFDTGCELVSPIFKKLRRQKKWTFNEIRFIALVLGHSNVYEESLQLAWKALKRLEEYLHEEQYPHVKVTIHVNTLARLLQAKYKDREYMGLPAKLKDFFLEHVDEAVIIAEEHDFPMSKAIAIVRKGIFLQEDRIIHYGLELAEECGDIFFKMMQDEVSEYEVYQKYAPTQGRLNAIVGQAIVRERDKHSLTTEDLAKKLGFSEIAMQNIEEGKKQISLFHLFKLSELFDIPVDMFLYASYEELHSDNIQAKRKKSFALISGITDSDLLDHIVDTLQYLQRTKKSKK